MTRIFPSCRNLAAWVALGLALAGCAASRAGLAESAGPASYSAMVDAGYRIDAVPAGRLAPRFRRQTVGYGGSEAPGTVVVDVPARWLYLVMPGNRALRYGVSVGRAAHAWSGTALVGRKASWPRWTPTADMLERNPSAARYRGGVAPGPLNPLGARALYLEQNGRDTLFRIHGTAEWWSIGDSASSGCIRLLNQDVVDLYNRVPVGARVIVRGTEAAGRLALRP